MNTALWIIQILLTAMFVFAGITKLSQPREKLEKQFPWVSDFFFSTVRFIGLSEFLGVVGLIVPWLTGVAPVLTPVAACGIALIMILASTTVHLKKKEYQAIGINVVILLLAAFVAYGRF